MCLTPDLMGAAFSVIQDLQIDKVGIKFSPEYKLQAYKRPMCKLPLLRSGSQ